MSHILYPPSTCFDTLIQAGEALADKGNTRLARRLDIATDRIGELRHAAELVPREHMSERLRRALAAIDAIVND